MLRCKGFVDWTGRLNSTCGEQQQVRETAWNFIDVMSHENCRRCHGSM